MTTEIFFKTDHNVLQNQDHTDNVCVHFNVTGEWKPLYINFSVDIKKKKKTRYKKLFTHVESHASAVSLLESGE